MTGEADIRVVVPWHRLLDRALPDTCREWFSAAERAVASRPRSDYVVRMIHPVELEAWAQENRRTVNEPARVTFAERLWNSGTGGLPAHNGGARGGQPSGPPPD